MEDKLTKSTNADILIKVEGVSKKFCRKLKLSLWYGLTDLFIRFFRIKRDRGILRRDEFWAVKDASFELKRGQCLGLIGHNGSGKSTLLKMLNGLINPDQGKITVNGKVGALIELGAGFNPLLTGRENVYINGQILGFSKNEVDQKYQAIVDFAELPDFMETPVQNYSSGMKVRLGFAVAAQMEPDVLIIDEVLAVGDIGFQVKCFNKINELAKNCAVILVTHSMPNIGRLSSKTILLKNGAILLSSNNSSEAIEAYYSSYETETQFVISKVLTFDGIVFLNDLGKKIRFGEDLIFEFSFISTISIDHADLGIAIMDQSLRKVGAMRCSIGQVKKGKNSLICRFDEMRFAAKTYYFSIEINRFENGLKKEVMGLFQNIGTFTMIDHPFEVESVIFLKGNVKMND